MIQKTIHTKNINYSFGSRIRALRKARGLSISEASELSTISTSYWSGIENYKREIPSTSILELMAVALGVNKKRMLKMAGFYPNTNDLEDLLELSDIRYRGKALNGQKVDDIKDILDDT